MKNKSLDQSLNIGSEIQLFEGCVKQIRIGNIKLIRELRQKMKEVNLRFSFCIGRGKISDGADEIDCDALEAKYKEAFNLILIEGITEEEYDQIDESGIKELDHLLERFL